MFERQSKPRLADDLSDSADLAALRAGIAKGMSDVQEGQVSTVNIASIKAAGRATLNARCTSRFSSFFARGASENVRVIGQTAQTTLL